MLDWKKMNDLIPAIVQDANSREILMLGYMNPESWDQTLTTKQVTFYSRSKQALWKKGETSGNTLTLVDYRLDCDQDAILLLVQPAGPTCHTGTTRCFQSSVLDELQETIGERRANPSASSYTSQLFEQGLQRIAQKVGEESVEVILAAMANQREEVINESADLLFHWLVLLNASGVTWAEVLTCLKNRRR